MDYYSLKMRASQVVGESEIEKHEQHISGAERIVKREDVESVCQAMVRRALNHPKGDPDKINIKIEKVKENEIQILDALPVTRIDVDTWQEGLAKAYELINQSFAKRFDDFRNDQGTVQDNADAQRTIQNDIQDALKNFSEKLPQLLRETYPMRGAMLYDIRSGKRLEPDQNRGVRATYMDAVGANEIATGKESGKNHFNEAIVLATKVANAPGIVAELCISDDPDYVTGYVGSLQLGYVRIMKMKEMGNPDGGRIFLFDSSVASAEECIAFLQQKKVLVKCKRD